MSFYPVQTQRPNIADVDPRPENRKHVGLFELGQFAGNLEIADTHNISLTAGKSIYKGWESG